MTWLSAVLYRVKLFMEGEIELVRITNGLTTETWFIRRRGK